MTTTPSRHATSLTDGEIVEENDLGSIRRVTADSFPILSGMSIKRIVLTPGAMRAPFPHCCELASVTISALWTAVKPAAPTR